MARLAAATLATVLGGAEAWWDNGHMLTAEVARLALGSDAAHRVDELLADWEANFPGTSDMVSAAVWPDKIKCNTVSPLCKKPDALNEFDFWHFSDLPYNPDGLRLPDAAFQEANGNPSATWALSSAMRTFAASKTRFAFNFMLRMTLHVVGDLHQPLHAASGYFNDTALGWHPDGDRGGNSISIRAPPGLGNVSNLHLLWDAGAGLYLCKWPFTEDQKAELLRNATELMRRFPREDLPQYDAGEISRCWGGGASPRECEAVFRRWANESHELALSEAYSHGLRQDEVPSVDYLANAQRVVQRQIALAGYRLADVLRVVVPELPPARARPLQLSAAGWTAQGAAPGGRALGLAALAGLAVCAAVVAALLLEVRRLRRGQAEMQEQLLLNCEV